MVKCENIRKAYGEKLILDGAELSIAPGEAVALLGPSGSGKTTLARLLCGLTALDEGRVLLEDKLLCSAHTPYDRKRGLVVQMVYQQPYASLDGAQRLRSGFYELLKYHGFAKNRAEAKRMTEELLSSVGLNAEILSRRPGEISGGEAQRAALARSLLFHPKLLILDEATSMLDVSTGANVLALVRERVLNKGSSVLFITHDKELAESFSDRIYVLAERKFEEMK